jgi:hypothetical protein
MQNPFLSFIDICFLPCRLLSHILDFFAIAGKFAGGMNASDFPPPSGFALATTAHIRAAR